MTRRTAPSRPDDAALASTSLVAPAPLVALASRGAVKGGFVLERGRILAKKYVLDRPAGFGGMAELWVATNQATGAEVCVKILVLGIDAGPDEELGERFRREAHAAARLSHRAIVRVFDLLELDITGDAVEGTSPAYAYAIVMELLRGETLGDLLAKRGSLPLSEAIDLLLPIVSALGHAHRASVIHRDIKPDNIFLAVDPDGHVTPKILDFGVSKLQGSKAITIDGVVLGTPSFMSPEQARGARRIDARSDVFALGILFYVMLTGKNPFDDGASFATVVEAVMRRDVKPIDGLEAPIWAVIERAIEKVPDRRFVDAVAFGVALRRASGRTLSTDSTPIVPSSSSSSQWSVEAASPSPSVRPERLPSQNVASRDGRRHSIVTMLVAMFVSAAAVMAIGVVATTIARSKDPRGIGASASGSGTPSVSGSETQASSPEERTAKAASSAFVAASASEAARASSQGQDAAVVPGVAGTSEAAKSSPTKPQNARDPGF